jgi:peroxiredoxin
MKLFVNQELPHATFYEMTPNGPEAVSLIDLSKNKRIILLGMPGAFTKTCTTEHLPSLIKNSKLFFDKGIDEIICIVVNDVHVAKAWGDITGATKSGIRILTDPESKFTKSIGLEFSVPIVGFFDRLQRIAIIADNNNITHVQLEEEKSSCDLTSGDTLLSLI